MGELTANEEKLYTALTMIGEMPVVQTRASISKKIIELWSSDDDRKVRLLVIASDMQGTIKTLIINILRKDFRDRRSHEHVLKTIRETPFE